MLTAKQKKFNSKLSRDRITVENFFGRMQSLWAMMKVKYVWSEKDYDTYLRLCVALTHYHIVHNPLRVEDGKAYKRWLHYIKREGLRRERR